MIRKSPLLLCLLVLASCAKKSDGPDVDVAELVGGATMQAQGRNYYSPDGTRLAYTRQLEGVQAVFVANADGSNPVRLTHGIWDNNPVWSPDGKSIAYYADEGADIWVVPSTGGEPRQLTSGPASDGIRGWLRDGSGVVFVRTGAGDARTMVVPVAGGPARLLFDEPAGNVFAYPSPDGSKFAYLLNNAGRGTIWVRDTSAGPPKQLTTDGLEDFRSARAWSPDGRFILFWTRRTGTSDLWTVNVETGEQRQLTDDIRNDSEGAWSPDGRCVVFISDRGGQTDLWIVAAAGGPAQRVTADLDVEAVPEWSPDGKRVVYTAAHYVASIDVMPADGGTARSLTSLDGYGAGGLAVSPDGLTLLYHSNRSGSGDIWSVPLAGGEPKVLVGGPLDELGPYWSPDGSQVVFTSNRRGATNDVWVMPAAGGEPRQLTDWPSDENAQSWSPDGRTIAFTSDREASHAEVWTIPPAGGQATRVSHGNVNAGRVVWSRDGRTLIFMGISADGSRQVYSVPASGGPSRRFHADTSRDRKSTRLNSSHGTTSRMPSSA